MMLSYLFRFAGWIATAVVFTFVGYQAAWPNSFIHRVLWSWQDLVLIVVVAVSIVLVSIYLFNKPNKLKTGIAILVGVGVAAAYYNLHGSISNTLWMILAIAVAIVLCVWSLYTGKIFKKLGGVQHSSS